MTRPTRTTQLQIRVSPAQKAAIQRAARRAGLDMSGYVLARTLSAPAEAFQGTVRACFDPGAAAFALSELNRLLSGLAPAELAAAIASPPPPGLTPYLANYLAAMVEYACARRSLPPPRWTAAIPPLAEPVFGSSLQSLRLQLLRHSPPPFRRRNIFIDASLDAQV